MTAPNANAWLMTGGSPTAKFDTPGTTVAGTITAPPEIRQQTDFDTGKPLFWDDGKPRYQLVVNVDTGQVDPNIDNDDGVRALYIKANLQTAVRDAVRLAGADGLEVGGHLTVTYTGDGTATRRGMNPPKLYSAVYKPPAANKAQEFLQATPQPSVEPQQQPAPGLNPQQLAALQALGIDPSKLGGQ